MKRMICLLLTVTTTPLRAWYAEGHIRSTDLAMHALEDRVPSFFTKSIATISHCSVDPDVFKFNTQSGLLKDDENPEHFFDLELFTDDALPENRMDFFFWCLRNDVYIQKIGTLPYALGEATDRLTITFAEHRRWPENPDIQTKCLVYAGNLAHYAQDLCQPLHATIHYDGRANAKGYSPRTGIHAKVDALLGMLDVNQVPAIAPENITPYDDLLPAILDEIRASNRQVDRIYELENDLPDSHGNTLLDPNSPVALFARERWAASALVTARLFLYAWTQSENVVIPSWHQR